MNILVIDNFDSFTFNIIEILRKNSFQYTVLNYGKHFNIKNFDKIIISPGPGLPTEYPLNYNLLKSAIDENIPVLGICLGHQIIGTFFGATLKQIPPQHGVNMQTKILEKNFIFKNFPDKIITGLYHSWALDNNKFPDNLKVTAIAQNQIIMSIRHNKNKIFGVQFHPESYITHFGEEIIKNFIND